MHLDSKLCLFQNKIRCYASFFKYLPVYIEEFVYNLKKHMNIIKIAI